MTAQGIEHPQLERRAFFEAGPPLPPPLPPAGNSEAALPADFAVDATSDATQSNGFGEPVDATNHYGPTTQPPWQSALSKERGVPRPRNPEELSWPQKLLTPWSWFGGGETSESGLDMVCGLRRENCGPLQGRGVPHVPHVGPRPTPQMLELEL